MGNEGLSLKSAEQLVESMFGPKPEFLKDGIEIWHKECRKQAEQGIKAFKSLELYDSFWEGFARYLHQHPKDFGAIEHQLKSANIIEESEKIPHGNIVDTERGNAVNVVFQQLFSRGSVEEIKIAGYSFADGGTIFENLKRMKDLKIDKTVISYDMMFALRMIDLEFNRRIIDDEELNLLLEAKNAFQVRHSFYTDHREEFIEGPSDELKNKKRKLNLLSDNTVDKWWEYFCKSVK